MTHSKESEMLHKRIGIALVTSTLATACSSTRAETASGEVSSPATPATAHMLPEGTLMELSLDRQLAAASSHTGDNFSATVANSVIALNGRPAVPAGAHVWGHVSGATSTTNASSLSVLVLDFDSLTYARRRFPFAADITSADVQKQGSASTYESVKSGSRGAVLNRADKEKALRAAGLGAVAGTAISMGRSGDNGVLPAGSRLSVQTTESIALGVGR
jgi:hypothetical protein